MISLDEAAELIDFSTRLDRERAHVQLEGAVALHNMLSEQPIAYLADEVGMGKTYVALGAVALFRHLNPSFRVLVLTPKENIQRKWVKELHNFVRNNVRLADLRVQGIDRQPARQAVHCDNLLSLLRETALDDSRDFFARLTSFSLPLPSSPDELRKRRDALRKELPWLGNEALDLRNRGEFKRSYGRAVCCGLPEFDLVIIDEAHNLKHGFSPHVSARNQVLASVLGRADPNVDARLFPTYGRRARHVLLLSATPVEDNYTQLWNQLDLVGVGDAFTILKDPDASDDEKRTAASKFLIRRVSTMRINGVDHTKNQYRRLWRAGGFTQFDQPLGVTDVKQRLGVALVQKKVAELLNDSRFNASFQIGMLASFESFLQTTKTKSVAQDEFSFDNADQADDDLEKHGLDVQAVNRLARSYEGRFGQPLPHPKMDGLVAHLADSWRTGRKALVFVRRIASVTEIKRKLDGHYDQWLIDKLRGELPKALLPRFERLVAEYRAERKRSTSTTAVHHSNLTDVPINDLVDDAGGNETFFAWFFRGQPRPGVVSGAAIQRRLTSGSPLAVMLSENHVMTILGTSPANTAERVAVVASMSREELATTVGRRASWYLPRAQNLQRQDYFDAVQAATLELLAELPGIHQTQAHVTHTELFFRQPAPVAAKISDPLGQLDQATLWNHLGDRPDLCALLAPQENAGTPLENFKRRQLRLRLLSSALRLGHAFIDLYVTIAEFLPNLNASSGDRISDIDEIATRFIAKLDQQRLTLRSDRDWGAFDELVAISNHFDLLIDANANQVLQQPVSQINRTFGALLGAQQPVGGMSGQINQTLVRQFRMPGYPFVMISTDLLQEGEDLHTFCSSVYHYGITWTPSAMEQRTGRIDRVQSQTERRLSELTQPLAGDDKLQVYFPHLRDTVEVLQVRRVLERLDAFLILMHKGLGEVAEHNRRLDVAVEILAPEPPHQRDDRPLETAFPIAPRLLRKARSRRSKFRSVLPELLDRFEAVANKNADLGIDIIWDPLLSPTMALGTAELGHRIQPFTLLLQSHDGAPFFRCISPIGTTHPQDNLDNLVLKISETRARVGAFLGRELRSYDLTVEDAVRLAGREHDTTRVGSLIRRVVVQADEFELALLPDRDRQLAEFRDDLESEGRP